MLNDAAGRLMFTDDFLFLNVAPVIQQWLNGLQRGLLH